MNYFQLFEIEERYDIDMLQLQQKYLALQAKYHPDRAIGTEKKTHNLSISIKLNNGYKILTDDIKRAEYLLSLKGFEEPISFSEEAASKAQLADIWFSLEIAEETDEIESLQAQLDVNSNHTKQLLQKLKNVFTNNYLQEAMIIIVQLKYLHTVIEYIKSKINLCK